MKTTMWTELQANECSVIKVDDRGGHITSAQIRHVSLKRPLWFIQSRAGNWYWRNAGGDSETYAAGYIVRGALDGFISVPRAYPELA